MYLKITGLTLVLQFYFKNINGWESPLTRKKNNKKTQTLKFDLFSQCFPGFPHSQNNEWWVEWVGTPDSLVSLPLSCLPLPLPVPEEVLTVFDFWLSDREAGRAGQSGLRHLFEQFREVTTRRQDWHKIGASLPGDIYMVKGKLPNFDTVYWRFTFGNFIPCFGMVM